MKINTSAFGTTSSNQDTTLFTLINANGMSASVTDFGATLTGIQVPNKDGSSTDVVLGFESVLGYEENSGACFGATVGRYANRISNASFELNGKEYKLTKNFGPHTLHGGDNGYSKVVW